ncbi:MAG: LacI family transcriptional regulator, partial [Tannerella sp.]|nr:LacI family transcriptional regulator [Tannerella sp.]
MARVSIKDIAREVGVSTAAVSLVLNGKNENGRIGKEMSEKIRRKAKEMHYEPNNLARGLRIGCSNTIGLILADISNLFFANLAFHIQEQAEKQGYSVIITNTSESDLKMEKMINVLKSRQVDGFIIVPTEHGDKYIADLLKRRMPVVLIDRFFPHLRVSSVMVDNYNAARKAIEKMIRQGCRNIGMLVYQTELQHMQDRKRGYVDVMEEHQMFNPALVKEIGYSFLANDVPIAIEHLMVKENRVEGIFFATNTLSMTGIKQLMNMGLRIPEDVKVICFDKSDAFDFA